MDRLRIQTEYFGRINELYPDEDLIYRFIEDCKLRGLSSNSVESYKYILNNIVNFLSECKLSLLYLDNITLKKILRYLKEERRLNNKTIENYFSVISSLYQFHIYENMINKFS